MLEAIKRWWHTCLWGNHHYHFLSKDLTRQVESWQCKQQLISSFLWSCCWCGHQKWATSKPLGRGDYACDI